ncbi:MAG TPA: hypothetical protein VGF63_11635, partial [Solirubrobacteraceae bacterium]
MRRASAALLMALAAGAGAGATPAGALGTDSPGHASGCAARGARVLARSAALSIYETRPRTGGP